MTAQLYYAGASERTLVLPTHWRARLCHALRRNRSHRPCAQRTACSAIKRAAYCSAEPATMTSKTAAASPTVANWPAIVSCRTDEGFGRGLARSGRSCGSRVTPCGTDVDEGHFVAFDQVAEVWRRGYPGLMTLCTVAKKRPSRGEGLSRFVNLLRLRKHISTRVARFVDRLRSESFQMTRS
jgi:hypothetical protein